MECVVVVLFNARFPRWRIVFERFDCVTFNACVVGLSCHETDSTCGVLVVGLLFAVDAYSVALLVDTILQ